MKIDGQALLKEWQARLGLMDWKITLKDNLMPDEMLMENVDGDTEWSEAIKTAKIEILSEQAYGKRIIPFDYEKTLVHELLHLKTCLISDGVDKIQERVAHQLIDDLARAFVDAKRGVVSRRLEDEN